MTDFSVFINRLVADTGLDKSVVTAWVSLEQGVNNNALGMTDVSLKTTSNTHGLYSYANQTVAADATAARLKSSPQYAGIIASTSGTPAQQAMAIAQSPWHLGGAGLKAAGGTDPYYLAGFVKRGLLTGIAGTAPTPPGSANPGPGVQTLGTLWSNGLPGNTPLTEALIQLLLGDSSTATNSKSAQNAYYDQYLNKPISNVPVMPGSVFGSGSLLTGTGGIPPVIDLPGALMFIGVVLVGIAFLGVGGLVALKGKK